MKTCADYIATAKEALGNPRMTDRELGVELGKAIGREPFANSAVNGGKTGNISDRMAVAISVVTGIPAGEVLTVAKLARERDPVVKAAWEDWVGKISGLLDQERGAADVVVLAGPNTAELAPIEVAMTKRKARQVSRAGSRSSLAETEGFEPSMRFWRILP